MIVIGLREVRITKLRLPGDWKKTMEDPSLDARAKSIDKHGLIHEPVVRQSDWKLGPGRRRVAAHLRLGKDTILCKLVECTDEELENMVDAENAEREHDPQKQREATARLVERMADQLVTANPILHKQGKGRGRTAKGLVRKELAHQMNVKPETIRMREYRAQKEDKVAEAKPKGPVLEGGWVVLDDSYLESVAAVQQGLDDANNLVLQALRTLTALQSKQTTHKDRFDRLHDELSQAGAAVRGLRPKMICPWCKGVNEIQPKCVPCRGTAYITADQVQGAPKELRRTEDPLVVHLGKQKPMHDFFPEETYDGPMAAMKDQVAHLIEEATDEENLKRPRPLAVPNGPDLEDENPAGLDLGLDE